MQAASQENAVEAIVVKPQDSNELQATTGEEKKIGDPEADKSHCETLITVEAEPIGEIELMKTPQRCDTVGEKEHGISLLALEPNLADAGLALDHAKTLPPQTEVGAYEEYQNSMMSLVIDNNKSQNQANLFSSVTRKEPDEKKTNNFSVNLHTIELNNLSRRNQ